MKTEYDVKISNYRFDAIIDDSILIEHKAQVSDIRIIDSTLLMIAKTLAKNPEFKKGVFILEESSVSVARLQKEWEDVEKLIKIPIMSKLGMVLISESSVIMRFGDVDDQLVQVILKIRDEINGKLDDQLKKTDAFSEILKILLVNWFRASSPLPINRLVKMSGFSYPTVAGSLEKLEPYLMRRSNRSVKLKSFPKDDWFKLVAMQDDIRNSKGFTARRPRPISEIIERLKNINDESMAIGGIIGARFYMPSIDLIGIPRIDISVLNWSENKIEKLVHKIDPGFEKSAQGDLPQIVIHNIYRQASLFNKGEDFQTADEVECLLDLQEARLESQALELLDSLKKKANQWQM